MVWLELKKKKKPFWNSLYLVTLPFQVECFLKHFKPGVVWQVLQGVEI